MSAPEKAPEETPTNMPELTLTDHYLSIIKLALEFNASVVAIATSVVSMDNSGHNRTTHKRISHELDVTFDKYKKNLDYANAKIVTQFFPKEAQAQDDGAES